MKIITVCQPYASLICLPETDPRHKRVENRTWATRYRGPLVIHAGKSTGWLRENPQMPGHDVSGLKFSDMPLMAIVARCQLVDCLHIDRVRLGCHDATFPWIKNHEHANGPFCFVLENVEPLYAPIPYRGVQGLVDISESVLATEGSAIPLQVWSGRLDGQRRWLVADYSRDAAAKQLGRGGASALRQFMGIVPANHDYRKIATEPGIWVQENWRDEQSEFTRRA